MLMHLCPQVDEDHCAACYAEKGKNVDERPRQDRAGDSGQDWTC